MSKYYLFFYQITLTCKSSDLWHFSFVKVMGNLNIAKFLISWSLAQFLRFWSHFCMWSLNMPSNKCSIATWDPKWLLPKIFFTDIFLSHIFIGPKKFSDPIFFWGQKLFWKRHFFTHNLFYYKVLDTRFRNCWSMFHWLWSAVVSKWKPFTWDLSRD